MSTIKLRSSDDQVIEVDKETACCFGTIKAKLANLGAKEGDQKVIYIENVHIGMLTKVIEWATYHKNNPPPAENDKNKKKRTDEINSWNAEFLNVDPGTLMELTLASSKLDIQGLLNAILEKFKNIVKGKTAEEARRTLGLSSDAFPGLVEEMVRKFNK